MTAIELMLTGQMEMPEFVALLKSDQKTQEELNNLIPTDAIGDNNHNFWTHISFDSLKRSHFDFLKYLNCICRFDGTIRDNLNVFGSICSIYMYSFPDIAYTHKYHDAFGLYLDVIKDCFDGPEVRHLMEKIIQDALLVKSKRKQKEQAKIAVQEEFHVMDSLRPRWIQGPEWPMGAKSPMRFIAQKKSKEQVQYFFEDVDTKSTRTVKQFY